MTLAFPKPSRPKKAPRRLTRKTWMRKRRPRRLSRPGSDLAYLGWLHTQPCVFFAFYPNHECSGGIQSSHLRHNTGLGLKEADRNAVPMCRALHEAWEQHRGPFRGLSKLQRFAIFTQWIADTQATYKRWEQR